MEALELAIKEIRQALPGMTLLENEPMAAHCSFKIGGPVRALAAPGDAFSLAKVCSILKDHELAPFILGNGTNLLPPDEGLQDLLMISTEKLQRLDLLPDGAIYAEAGVSLSRLASFAHQNGLAGLEFASGIPGSVGGGCYINAGAYGGEMKDAIESVVCLSLQDQGLYEIAVAQCDYGYRQSYFTKHAGCVILAAVFRLQPGDKDEIAARMREMNDKRRQKQPLELPSAGSAFKRPAGHYAGALIEQAGLKGYTVGGAQVSEKHAGFVVNIGGATSHDVYDLMMHVRNTVYEQSGVELEPEIIILAPDYKLEDHGPKVRGNRVTVNSPDFGEEKK